MARGGVFPFPTVFTENIFFYIVCFHFAFSFKLGCSLLKLWHNIKAWIFVVGMNEGRKERNDYLI